MGITVRFTRRIKVCASYINLRKPTSLCDNLSLNNIGILRLFTARLAIKDNAIVKITLAIRLGVYVGIARRFGTYAPNLHGGR